jgi:hypothetical protein
MVGRGAPRDSYLEIHDRHGRRLDQILAQRTQEIALRESDVERLAIDETEKELKAGTVKDASAAARNMSVVKGVATDKLLTLTGRPVSIVEHRSAEDIAQEARGRRHHRRHGRRGPGSVARAGLMAKAFLQSTGKAFFESLMALTLTPISTTNIVGPASGDTNVRSKLVAATVSIDPGTSYTKGGFAVNASQLGLAQLRGLRVEPTSVYQFAFDFVGDVGVRRGP